MIGLVVFKGIYSKIENNGKKKYIHHWIPKVPPYRFGYVPTPTTYVTFHSRGVFMRAYLEAQRLKQHKTIILTVTSLTCLHNSYVIPILLENK